MATTKLWAIHSRLDHLVDYAANTEKTYNPLFDDLQTTLHYADDGAKTEQRFFVTGINCNPETAYERMCASHKMSNKTLRVLGYHGYQSFIEGEVRAEAAHEIGVRLARELWGSKFVVVVATHLNTGHYHNHFVLCSTSFVDGSRYHCCKESYRLLRETSDRLCREYGLSVIESPNGKGKPYAERTAERAGKPTYSSLIRDDVDLAISCSRYMKQFYSAMEALGYELKFGKYIAVRAKGAERFRRLKTLGEDYTESSILRRIHANRCLEPPFAEQLRSAGSYRFHGTLHTRSRLSGLRALYYHYLYKMGIIQRSDGTHRRAPTLLREDLIKLDGLIAQNKLLCREGIDTIEQLNAYSDLLSGQMSILESARYQLRLKLKRQITPEERTQTSAEITDITEQLRATRKDLRLCGDIAQRSQTMRAKLKTLNAVYAERTEFTKRRIGRQMSGRS